MDWIDRMNEAIGYVEEHLTDELDTEAVSRIMACPFSLFQSSFIQVTDIPLSEYIRRRKLTCAAYDLMNTEDRVIDIALKYGYESADAFRVAFKRIHGITPSQVRKSDKKLTFYCRLHLALSIKGVFKMDYRFVKKEGFKVIGKRRTTPYGGGTWAVVKSDGSADYMKELSGHLCDLGLCFGFAEDGSNDYMCGILWEGEDVPGLDSYLYPESSWLLFEAKGRISEQVLGDIWFRINQEFLPQGKFKKSGLPTIEKYVAWDEAVDVCHVEIWIPVAEK